jgi:hypothetical protein
MYYTLYLFFIAINLLGAYELYGAHEELNNLKTALHIAQEKVTDSVASLKSGHINTQRAMINPLETTSTQLKDQITRLHQTHTLSKATGEILKGLSTIALLVPGLATASGSALLLFADIPIIIDSLENTLQALQATMLSIKKEIATVNEELNPRTDPKGIYKHFEKAHRHFQRALDSIDALQAHTT